MRWVAFQLHTKFNTFCTGIVLKTLSYNEQSAPGARGTMDRVRAGTGDD